MVASEKGRCGVNFELLLVSVITGCHNTPSVSMQHAGIHAAHSLYPCSIIRLVSHYISCCSFTHCTFYGPKKSLSNCEFYNFDTIGGLHTIPGHCKIEVLFITPSHFYKNTGYVLDTRRHLYWYVRVTTFTRCQPIVAVALACKRSPSLPVLDVHKLDK